MSREEIVFVTGFGPFRQFLVNPNWKTAQSLKLVGLGEKTHVCTKEVPVSYVKTQKIIAEIWQTLHPKFAVHLGEARGSSVVSLEQTARNSGYRDVEWSGGGGVCPDSHCCVCVCGGGGAEKLSVVNMKAVAKEFRQGGTDVIYSRELLAGRNLCEFAYYCSLYHGQRRAALIWQPDLKYSDPGHRLFSLLPSGRRYRSFMSRTNRLKNCFYPWAVRLLNHHT
ncbi:pyroglutamyl-peptidase 1-like [Gymnodraco acuticeps]|uniref:Pyroglutamyl-peptidase 1-like n=1 Tax=Gymnodraco acuticeps TaxID=8218 RepID=A0A6P8VGS5_GYMAC|nr:pyroglutamyl-peptidase 1-like [Gymnodraco acuticeps]